MIEMVADPTRAELPLEPGPGVDAVKLTLRDLKYETTRSMGESEYDGFGETYDEHRWNLELNHMEHAELYKVAKKHELDFIETVCAPSCLHILDWFEPDWLKIASRDLANDTLVEEVAKVGLPTILSTGMLLDYAELETAVELLREHCPKFAILHCVSEYPAAPEHLGLGRIVTLKEFFPDAIIGYSDHSMGLVASNLAVALGAEIIEKHVTLDRSLRGSDHAGALERDGVWRWVRDTRLAEQMLEPVTADARARATEESRYKLQRSVAAGRTIELGETISEDDLIPLSPGTGIPWKERHQVYGQTAECRIAEHELVHPCEVGLPNELRVLQIS